MRRLVTCAKALRSTWGVLAMASFCLGAASSVASAQRYDQINPKLTAPQARALRPTLAAILSRNSALSDEDKATLNNYYLGYKFPAMTITSPDALAQLATEREGLIRELNQVKSTSARAYLLDRTLKQMMTIAANADGNYHPAVRYNATLVISELDQDPAQGGAGSRAPTVWPEATKTLLAIASTTKLTAAPPPVKVAALVGLARHARFGIDEQYMQPTTDAMLAVVTAEDRPKHIAKDVYHWMKCQAASVLAAQHAAGLSDAVSAALLGLIADEGMSLDDRCYCASLLVETMFSGGSGAVDYNAYQTVLGGLAKAVLTAEAKKANEYNDELLGNQPGGRGYGGGGRGYGGGGGREYGGGGGRDYGGGGRGYGGGGGRGGYGRGGIEEDLGPHYEIRRMLDRVLGIVAGLDAVTPTSGDPVQSRLSELKTALQQLADAAGQRGALEADVADVVIKTARAVEQMIGSWETSEDPVAAAADQGNGLLARE